jgi:hypothetical protein
MSVGGEVGVAEVSRLSLAVAAAGVLLHEISHCCGSPSNGFPDRSGLLDQGPCSPAHMLENAFTWAIVLRYPDVLDGGSSAVDEARSVATFLSAGHETGAGVAEFFVGSERCGDAVRVF